MTFVTFHIFILNFSKYLRRQIIHHEQLYLQYKNSSVNPMELKFVNVVSVAMMDKENINNMQIVDTQDNQLIEEKCINYLF